MPPIHEILTNPLINNDDFANAIAVQALNAEPTPSIPEMALVWDPMNAAIYDIVTGKASAENALNKAKIQIQSAIDGNSSASQKAQNEEKEATAPDLDESIATEDTAASDNEDSLAHSSEALESDANESVSNEETVSHDQDENVDESFSVEVENAPTEATKSDDASSKAEASKTEDSANTENKEPEKTEEKKSLSLDSLDFG